MDGDSQEEVVGKLASVRQSCRVGLGIESGDSRGGRVLNAVSRRIAVIASEVFLDIGIGIGRGLMR